MTETINEDGTPVLIEAVYHRHGSVYAWDCDSIEDALNFLECGEDDGELAAVGVFVEGKPHTPRGIYVYTDRTIDEAKERMAEWYKKVQK